VNGPDMQKLRLAIVAPTLRILGGQAVQADRLLRQWRDDPDVDAWLVPVNPVPPRGLRFAVNIKYLRTIVTELTYLPLLVRELAKADVVHVFSASYSSFLLAPLPAAAIARMLGRPIVLNYHSGEAPDHLARSRVARTVLAGLDRRVVPSRFLAGVFRRFGLEATIVPNTIDLDEFAFRERDSLRPRILSTRNLSYPYNVACTLRAFQEIQRRRADASLTLVGGGPDEPALRALAADLRLRNVQFRGRLAPEAIAAAYEAHDIYLQSPDIDNMPLSVLEAFASGLPVVSTGVGGVPAMLTHEEHGLLAPPGDHRTLATHVLRLLDDPAMARRLARAARGTCDDCTWSRVRNQWLRIYFSVLTEPRTVEPRPRQARVDVSDES
jgi:glycosyltransferase involved in cell wall biosynthesis